MAATGVDERWELRVRPSFDQPYLVWVELAAGARTATVDYAPRLRSASVPTLSPSQSAELVAVLRQLSRVPEEAPGQGLDGVTWFLTYTGETTLERSRWAPDARYFMAPGGARFLELAHRILAAVNLGADGPERSALIERVSGLSVGRVFALQTAQAPQSLDSQLERHLEWLRRLRRGVEEVLATFNPETLGVVGLPSLERVDARVAHANRLLSQLQQDPELRAGCAPDGPRTAYILKHYAGLDPDLRALEIETRRLVQEVLPLVDPADAEALQRRIDALGLGPSPCILDLRGLRARIADRLLEAFGDAIVVTTCARCGALAAGPDAFECLDCGHTWRPPVGDVPAGQCPHYHGVLDDWQGGLRCFTCGWPEKNQLTDCPRGHGPLPSPAPGASQPGCAQCGWPGLS